MAINICHLHFLGLRDPAVTRPQVFHRFGG